MQNFKPLAIFSDCTARFVSDLVGNPEDRFSHMMQQQEMQEHGLAHTIISHVTGASNQLISPGQCDFE